jgi:hypothetical protein
VQAILINLVDVLLPSHQHDAMPLSKKMRADGAAYRTCPINDVSHNFPSAQKADCNKTTVTSHAPSDRLAANS